MRTILIIDGHPDPDGARYGHAVAQTYADAARTARAMRCDPPPAAP